MSPGIAGSITDSANSVKQYFLRGEGAEVRAPLNHVLKGEGAEIIRRNHLSLFLLLVLGLIYINIYLNHLFSKIISDTRPIINLKINKLIKK